jgi:hypothetical protein
MDDFLSEEACLPNLNTATVAGKVLKVEALTGKVSGFAFTIGYEKHWPNGGVQTVPIQCYATGAERVEQLGWLKPGEVALVRGEITNKAAVFAHQLEWLSKPPREPGEGDVYLAEVPTEGGAH